MSPVEPQEPEPEPEPEQARVFGKAIYFKVVKDVRLDSACQPSVGSPTGVWLHEGAVVEVFESQTLGDETLRVRTEGGWATAVDGEVKSMRRDRNATGPLAAGADKNAETMAKLVHLTTQNLQTASHINVALKKQSGQLEEIDASAEEASQSTARLNASAARRLEKLGGSSTRSV